MRVNYVRFALALVAAVLAGAVLVGLDVDAVKALAFAVLLVAVAVIL